MKLREALAIWQKKKAESIAADVIEAVLEAAANVEDAEDRLTALTASIAGAERTLVTVRERIQTEDAAGRARMTEIQTGIVAAEREAAEKVQQFGREANARIDAARQAAKDTLDTLKRATDEEVRLIKAEVESERATLRKIQTEVARARAELAPLMGQAS